MTCYHVNEASVYDSSSVKAAGTQVKRRVSLVKCKLIAPFVVVLPMMNCREDDYDGHNFTEGIYISLQGQQITEGQQLSHSCPAICAKYCAPDCLVRCCNRSPPIPFAPSPPPIFLPPSPPPAVPYCPQICFRTCVNSCPAACCASTRQDINRNAMSYTVTVPCPDSCYPNCRVNCPPQCCATASKSNTPTSGTFAKRVGEGNIRGDAFPVGMSSASVSPLMVRSKLLCPDFCSKLCAWTCPKECCRGQRKGNIKREDNWNPALKGNCSTFLFCLCLIRY